MCLAILQKQNSTKLKESQLKASFENNNDGCGISYVSNNEIKIVKIMKLNELIGTYNQIHKNHSKTSHLMLHFRIGTHGLNTEYNVHPFKVNNKLVFCHNGIINKVPNHNKKSDTRVFNDIILKSLPNKFIKNQSIIKLMGEFIGHSKLIFLNSNNEFKIVNEQLGHWLNNVWFSNTSYKPNVYDFGGYSSKALSQCNINFSNDDEQLNPYNPKPYNKQTRYQKNDCDDCGEMSIKQHQSNQSNQWLCGLCYSTETYYRKGF